MTRDQFFSALDDLFKDFYRGRISEDAQPLTHGLGDVLRAKVFHLVGVWCEQRGLCNPFSAGDAVSCSHWGMHHG